MDKQYDCRTKILLNNEWTFQYGEYEAAMEADFDDSDWYHVGIPHSFGIPYFMENHFYVGTGMYRKTLHIDRQQIGKRIALEFQGVFQQADIYLNGILAGSHQGGYTAFLVDISELVHAGDNQLFIRVSNEWNPQLAPRAGEHVFNGGIYRDVSLLITEPVHISWYGTFVKTPHVSKKSAKLVVSTEMENHLSGSVDCTLESSIEYDGKEVIRMADQVTLQPGKNQLIVQEGDLARPHLWHPSHPRLYQLKSRLYRDGCLMDEFVTTFGVRWFYFTAHDGFFLNGEPYRILGANVHQDHAGWGDAVTHAGMERDVRMIKDCGMNFIRGSHYPHHSHFAEACDRTGILFWSELCFWGIGGFKEDGYWDSSAYPVNEEDQRPFEEHCLQTLREMIRVNRNHPSIIVWSMGNEVFFSHPDVMDKARRLVRRLVALSHDLDPTRPAASGGAQREDFDILGDLAGYNGDGAVLYQDPGFPSLVSEYGSCISNRPGEYAPHFTDGVETDPAWRCGKALWCGFHHGSIADRMGHMGFIDYYRLPLQSWYWYRERLLHIDPPQPLSDGIPYGLQLTADHLSLKTDGTDDAQIVVQVVDQNGHPICNSVAVTLEVEQGGALFPTGRTIRLSPEDENLLEGKGAIELRAFYAGKIRVTAHAAGLQPAVLELDAWGGEKWDGQKLQLQPAPPSVFVPNQDTDRIDLARSRPVFCSSFRSGFPSSNLNDGCTATFWQAASDAPGAWIRQDLEGLKQICNLVIRFPKPAKTKVQVSLGRTLETDDITFAVEVTADTPVIELAVDGEYRYIQLLFKGVSLPVSGLEVYG